MEWLSIKHPLSHNEIQEVEKSLNLSLPQDYKMSIGPINGGALRNAHVYVEGIGSVPYSRNVSLYNKAPANIFELLPAINDGTITLFPFGSVGNGDYFCFDLNAKSVVLYMHETLSVVSVCASFAQLIDMLVIE